MGNLGMVFSSEPGTNQNHRNSVLIGRKQGLVVRAFEKAYAPHMYSIFKRYFSVEKADNSKKLDDAYRLRYQVFCLEQEGFENADDHPDGREMDMFDRAGSTRHVVVYFNDPQTGEKFPLGTARLILPKGLNWKNVFPLQSVSRAQNSMEIVDSKSVRQATELSRLCISYEQKKLVRKRIDELDIPLIEKQELKNMAIKLLPIAIFQGVCEIALDQGILDFYCMMTPDKIKRLLEVGLVYTPVGDAVQHHGVRQPFHTNLMTTFDHMRENRPLIYKVLTKDGALHDLAHEEYQTADCNCVHVGGLKSLAITADLSSS